MKTFLQFVNESVEIPSTISIEDFVKELHFPKDIQENVIDWWGKNRNRIKIHYFPFNTPHPIMGCFLDENTVAINSIPRVPGEIKLFITLHESRHADQHKEGRFMGPYFDSVKNNDKQTFLKAYKELESESNDFTIKAMTDMGFDQFIRFQSRMLRGNEEHGQEVWGMMKEDIEKYKANDMFDLLLNQIL